MPTSRSHGFISARRIVLPFAFAAAMMMTGMPATGKAATSGDKASAAANWLYQCDGTGGKCRLLQNIVMQDSGQRLLTVVIEPRMDAPNHALVLALPHGVFLPAGVTIAIDDGEPVRLTIQTSDANGAYAGTTISDAFLAELKNGIRMVISFATAQKQQLAVPVTLMGFTAAYSQFGD